MIRIDLLGIQSTTPEAFEQSLSLRLERQAAAHGVSLQPSSPADQLWQLIHDLGEKRPVVVLIDEYDNPILDHIADSAIALRFQKLLATFYAVLKSAADRIRFVFSSGVSKLTRVSLFSDLNNLQDISLNHAFAGITGYTDDELDRYFTPHLSRGIGDLEGGPLREKIRTWYDGYSWDGQLRVHNPVSILELLENKRFAAYWYATGTPKFLLELLRARKPRLSELASLEIDELSLEGFAPDRIDMIALLFQTGYLTIKDARSTDFGTVFTMGYPNLEVERSFLTHVLADFSGDDPGPSGARVRILGEKLEQDDIAGFCESLQGLFASIPDNIFLPDREAYDHTVVYLAISLSGIPIIGELQTNTGRIDVVLETTDRIYVVEFKMGRAEEAVRQIRENGYGTAFRDRGKKVVTVGIGLDENRRNIGDWLVG